MKPVGDDLWFVKRGRQGKGKRSGAENGREWPLERARVRRGKEGREVPWTEGVTDLFEVHRECQPPGHAQGVWWEGQGMEQEQGMKPGKMAVGRKGCSA